MQQGKKWTRTLQRL